MKRPAATLHEWTERGQMFRRRREASSWDLAWWLVEGHEWDQGFKRSQAITGYASSTLFNLFRVGRAFTPDTYSLNLSFAAHKELLRETDEAKRMELHAKAVAEHWTQDDVLRHFKEHPPSSGITGQTATYQPVQVKCPKCAHEFTAKDHKVRNIA